MSAEHFVKGRELFDHIRAQRIPFEAVIQAAMRMALARSDGEAAALQLGFPEIHDDLANRYWNAQAATGALPEERVLL